MDSLPDPDEGRVGSRRVRFLITIMYEVVDNNWQKSVTESGGKYVVDVSKPAPGDDPQVDSEEFLRQMLAIRPDDAEKLAGRTPKHPCVLSAPHSANQGGLSIKAGCRTRRLLPHAEPKLILPSAFRPHNHWASRPRQGSNLRPTA